ncbi:MAG: TolC family protein [Kofleriaceae bacterium]|nr:TolC family protein [Kofleriaceae bacterium]
MRVPVDQALRARLASIADMWNPAARDAQAASTADMLRRPLDAQAAVAIALRNNPRLRVELTALGIPAGQVAQATAPRATDVDFLYRRGLADDLSEMEINVTQDIIELITTGSRRNAAKQDLQAAQLRATAMAIETAGVAEIGFYRLVAEQQLYELRQTVADLATSSFEFVSAQHAAGNVPDLTLLREQDNKAQADLDVAKSQIEVTLRRQQLATTLGLSATEQSWTVSPRLPALPAALAPAAANAEAMIVVQSLERDSLQREAEAANARLRLARIRSWVPELGVGVSLGRRTMPATTASEWDIGPAVRVALPLFNWNQGGRAVARTEVARITLAQTAYELELRATFRSALNRQQTTYAQARRVRDTIVPLRNKILSEVLLHYNAMNATAIELLMARRAQTEAGQQYIELLRDYWVAQTVISTMQRGGVTALISSPTGE